METPQSIRADFIKRLFAVSVSVGFATQISSTDWIKGGRLPVGEEWKEPILLIIAITAVVASWDGYFASINKKPLTQMWRFIVDTIIVFEYLFLMLLSKNEALFLWVLVFIFATYLFWDYLSILEHPSEYGTTRGGNLWIRAFPLLISGLAPSAATETKGPSITLYWGVYLFALAWLASTSWAWPFLALWVLVMAGLILYRLDKSRRFSLHKKLLYSVPAVIVIGLNIYFKF